MVDKPRKKEWAAKEWDKRRKVKWFDKKRWKCKKQDHGQRLTAQMGLLHRALCETTTKIQKHKIKREF